MSRILKIVLTLCAMAATIFLLAVMTMTVHAQSNGTISTLDQFTGTTSPSTAITQRTANKAIKITGLTTGQCLGLNSSNIVISTPCGTSGSGTVGTSTAETATYVPFWTSTGAGTALLSGGESTFAYDSALNKLTIANASTTALSIGSLTGILKQSGGVVVDAVADTDYQVPLTFGDGLTRTVNDVDCDTASGSVFGCLASADWTTFNAKQAAGNYITALTGDITATGPGSVAATLATVNSNVGSFTNASITVNAKGLITAASSGTAGLTSYDAWTHPAAGQSATTSLMVLNGNASTTQLSVSGSTWLASSLTGFLKGTSGLVSAVSSLVPGDISLTKGNFLVGNDAGVAQATSTIFISSIGQVGVGTTTPNAALTVTGGTATVDGINLDRLPANSSLSSLLFLSNSNSSVAIYNNTGDLSFNTGATVGSGTGTGRLRIAATNGNIGISSSTPYARLSVKGAGSTTGVNFQTTNSSDSPLVTILDSGNVGVGTTSPLRTLSVSGDSIITGTTTIGTQNGTATIAGTIYRFIGSIGTDDTAQNAGWLIERNATTCPFGCGLAMLRSRGDSTTKTVVSSGDDIGNIWGLGYDGTDYAVATRIQSEVDGTPGSNDMPGALRFYTTPDGSGTALERLTIKNTGNVGIGDTTPSYALDIAGTSGVGLQIQNTGDSNRGLSLTATGAAAAGTAALNTTSSGYALTFGIDGVEKMRVHTDGSVGIGTTSPSAKLHIGGLGSDMNFEIGGDSIVTQQAITAHINGNVGSLGLAINDGGGNSGVFINNRDDGTYNSQDITFLTAEGGISSATERMRITKAGYVGVGTTTPYSQLSVSTAAQQAGTLPLFTVASTTSATLFTVLGNGNVGIASSSPSHTLGVVGSGLFSSTLQALGGLITNVSATISLAINGAFGIDTTDTQWQFRSGGATYALSYEYPRTLGSIGSTSPDRILRQFSTGTTTWSFGQTNGPVTVNSIYGKTDIGTCLAVVGDGSASTTALSITSSGTELTGLSNNTFTDREEVFLAIGSCASTPNWVTPTLMFMPTPS